jgi:L-threonylcarbamoyladenylate synthase
MRVIIPAKPRYFISSLNNKSCSALVYSLTYPFFNKAKLLEKMAENIKTAVDALRAGHLVAFPTETVYGLGADASNAAAIAKVFASKGRPTTHPLIVHLASALDLNAWAREIPEAAWQLGRKFWPGPLTLILKKHPQVLPIITGGLDTIAVRVPNHPLTLQLLHEFAGGLVGPSANKYGRVSPTTAQHVRDDLGSAVAMVLDGGACAVGIESTIVDLSGAQPIIRRHGSITIDQISDALAQDILLNTSDPVAPGTHLAHYAPLTPMSIVTSAQLVNASDCAVLSFAPDDTYATKNIFWIQASLDPQQYAHDLYANLRALDKSGKTKILIAQPPTATAWQAINDRLQRAAVAHGVVP